MNISNMSKSEIMDRYGPDFSKLILSTLRAISSINIGFCVKDKESNETKLRCIDANGRKLELTIEEAKKQDLLVINLCHQDECTFVKEKIQTISLQSVLVIITSQKNDNEKYASFLMEEFGIGSSYDSSGISIDSTTIKGKSFKKMGKVLNDMMQIAISYGLLFDLALETKMVPLYHQMYSEEFPFHRHKVQREICRLKNKERDLRLQLVEKWQLDLAMLSSYRFSVEGFSKRDEIVSDYQHVKKQLSSIRADVLMGKNYEKKSFVTYIKPVGTVSLRCSTVGGKDGVNLYGLPKILRNHLLPRVGEELLTMDISACHPLILAHLAGETSLLYAYESGADIYREIAGAFFSVSPDEVTDVQRKCAKTITLILVNAGGKNAIHEVLVSNGIDVTSDECEKMYHALFAKYCKIEAFRYDLLNCEHMIAPSGHIWFGTTLSERRRRLAVLLQTIEAETVKTACIMIQEKISQLVNCRFHHTLHDSICVECMADDKGKVKAIIEDSVLTSFQQSFPKAKKIILKEE